MEGYMSKIDYTFLPQVKKMYLKELHERYSKVKEYLEVATYRNVTLTPLGQVVGASEMPQQDDIIIEDLDYCTKITEADGEAVDERIVLCGYFRASQWGHFITNFIARLWVAVTNLDDTIDRYVFFSGEEDCKLDGNFLEFFSLLDIADKIVITNHPVSYAEVIVPELSFAIEGYIALPYMRMLEKVRLNALDREKNNKAAHPEKIFFTRSYLRKSRNDVGLDILDRFMRMNGYEVIAPEKLTLTKMINVMAAAKEIAMISGSGCHNSIFAGKGKDIVIFERTSVINTFQPMLEAVLGHNVTYVEASYSLLPVSYGFGPFLYAMTPGIQAFATARGYSLPSVSHRTVISNMRRYLRLQESYYRYRWWPDDFSSDQLQVFNEGMRMARSEFAPLTGTSLIYVSPMRRLLRKIKGWLLK